MKQAIIIGAGPAGASAAIYLQRANVQTTIIYKDMGALGMAKEVENYYGFVEPLTGPELFNLGLEQAKRLGAIVVQDEVVGLGYEEKLAVLTKTKTYQGDVIIVATGTGRIAPKIPKLKELEGRGVSYCAICDAFFYRGKNVAVIGSGEYALHEAMVLAEHAENVTICTNGKPFTAEACPERIKINTTKVKALLGDDKLTGVELADGSVIDADGFFVAVGIAGSAELARKIGAEIDGTRIVIDENCMTNIEGLYACGDCTGGLLQITKAVTEGALAATHAAKMLQKM